MKINESIEEIINRTKTWIDDNEKMAEEQIERIHSQIDEHRVHIDQQIEQINNQIRNESETAEEQIRMLIKTCDQQRKTSEEQVENIQEAADEFERNIEDQIKKIENQTEHFKNSSEGQIEQIREQFEHKEDQANEQIQKIHEQIEESRKKAEEHFESIQEQIKNLGENLDSHSHNIHVETNTWIEEKNDADSVKSLMDTYDTEYNKRHPNTTISKTYVMNGVEILKYSGKLSSLKEMDKTFPREHWLQSLQDKYIEIQNIEYYCRYLNARDMLLRIKNLPKVWTSGLFDIPPTDNWETYREAFMDWITNPTNLP